MKTIENLKEKIEWKKKKNTLCIKIEIWYKFKKSKKIINLKNEFKFMRVYHV